MNHPNEEQMIAELQRAQSESIYVNTDEPDNYINDDIGGLNLDPITEEEIEVVENDPVEPPISAMEERTGNKNGGYRGGEMESSPPTTKFNADGYNKILRAKAEGKLVEFASVLPPPKERAKILAPETRVNNSDTWARYVYRAANNIPDNQHLGQEFQNFLCSLRLPTRLKNQEYMQIVEKDDIDAKEYNKALGILEWFRSKGKITADRYKTCRGELEELAP